jgi:hypothetical protein
MGDAIIPDDWLGEYCRFAVCWPNSPKWLGVLRGVLSIPQEGRFWEEASGTITEAQDIIEETFDYNFRNEEVIMACGDESIANALLAIATAMQGSVSGGNQSGCEVRCYSTSDFQVQTIVDLGDGDNFPIYGKEPIVDYPHASVPEGYDDIDQYLADKCAKSNKLVTDFITTIRNFGEIEWGLNAVTAVAILACLAGVITVPEVVLPTLMWILLSGLSISTACTGLANYLDANYQDVVCAIYEAEGVDAVISAVSALLTIAIATLSLEGSVAIALKQLAMLLLSSDNLNWLFTSKAKELYPSADCSDCDSPIEVLQIYDSAGAWVNTGWNWGEEVEFNPVVQSNGYYYLQVRIAFAGIISPGNYHLNVTAINNADNGSCGSQGSATGNYDSAEFGGSQIGWVFGCTNSFAPSLTGTFTKDT